MRLLQSPFRFPLIALLIWAFAGTALMAGEPRMIDAINALRRAKTSAEPWKELDNAAQNLRFAAKNKVGYRAEALHIVESAIASHPDKITLDRMIDDAIAKAEKAVTAGHRRRR